MEHTFEIFANGELNYMNELSCEDIKKIIDFASGVKENLVY